MESKGRLFFFRDIDLQGGWILGIPRDREKKTVRPMGIRLPGWGGF